MASSFGNVNVNPRPVTGLSYTAYLMSHVEPGFVLLLLLAAAGLAPPVRRRFGGRNLLTPLALVGLLLWSWMPAARLFALTCEAWYPSSRFPSHDAGAIVVLSGGLDDASPTQPFTLAERSTYRRSSYAAWLYKNWKPLPILASGGPIGKPPERVVASHVVSAVLRAAGVPPDRVWQEDRSLNTYENAVFSAEILRRHGIHRIALVTETRHMLRAELCFRKLGIEVVPAPCCSLTDEGFSTWREFLPAFAGIRENEATLHELLGLAWYRLKGWI